MTTTLFLPLRGGCSGLMTHLRHGRAQRWSKPTPRGTADQGLSVPGPVSGRRRGGGSARSHDLAAAFPQGLHCGNDGLRVRPVRFSIIDGWLVFRPCGTRFGPARGGATNGCIRTNRERHLQDVTDQSRVAPDRLGIRRFRGDYR